MSTSGLRPRRGLFEHLERYLGEVQRGWHEDGDGRLPFQLVQFADTPVRDATTFGTIGLSTYPLCIGKRDLGFELLIACHSGWARRPAVQSKLLSALVDLGLEMLERAHGPRRGDCTEPRGPLVEGSALEAICFTHPAFWPEELSEYQEPEELPVQMVLALPVSASEARFVIKRGWEDFESLLLQHDPDLLDLTRDPIV